MKLLIDSDAFCKLGTGGLLLDALELLGVDVASCGRLPALPHMLRRGRLPRLYGQTACDKLIEIAEAIPVIPPAEESWLDQLTGIPDIDPGEAQLFAAAAQYGFLVTTGDKRAMVALKNLPTFTSALKRRIVALEPLIYALCSRLGDEETRQRLGPVAGSDKVLMICFSSTNPNPRAGLLSYIKGLENDIYPLLLWEPTAG